MINLNSIYSDVSFSFVSNPLPKINEMVTVKIRFLSTKEKVKILLRSIVSGSNRTFQMSKLESKHGYDYYTVNIVVSQDFFNYHFIIFTENDVFYYNSKGVTHYPPTEDNDFVLLAGLDYPEWVAKSVFYQIFPDRFFSGDDKLSVKDGEYEFDGHSTTKMPWNEDARSYKEVFCLDFYGGDLEGIKQKIPYLKELGINALYINPIFTSNTSHRYDCVDYFNVDPHLGGNKALSELTRELHNNGIKIIIDISINHTGINHPWVEKALSDKNSDEYTFYYIDSKNNLKFWENVPTLPQLNYNSDKLRDIIYKNDNSVLKQYLYPEIDIDGWRFDVGNNTARHKNDQFGNEVFKEIRNDIKPLKEGVYIVGEHWKDSISYLLGDQWDSAMNYFGSGRPVRTFGGEPDRFFLNSLGPGQYKATSGDDLKHSIEQHYKRLPGMMQFVQFNLFDSHDIHRFHNNVHNFDYAVYRGMLVIMFMLPGTFSIYYGDEIGLRGRINDVEGCRYPMEWDESKWNRDFYDLYTRLISIKKDYRAMHFGSFNIPYSDNEVFVITRFDNDELLVGVVSKSEERLDIEFPLYKEGPADDILLRDLLSGRQFDVKDRMVSLNLHPKESLMLHCRL